MEQHCVVFIDKHGTPSVKGPFDTIDLATSYARHMQIEHGYDEDSKTIIKIAGLTPVSDCCDSTWVHS